MKKTFNITFLLFFTLQIFGQAVENKSVLTIEQIMQGEKFVGFSPTNIDWSDDSKTIYFNWNPDGEILKSRYKIDVSAPDNIEKVGIEELKAMSNNGNWNKNYTQKVFSKNGDIFIFNLQTEKTKQITNTLTSSYNCSFSNDEKFIVYTQNDNVFLWHIQDGTTQQITDLQDGSEKKES
jgi:Tol biopolymer transport system component